MCMIQARYFHNYNVFSFVHYLISFGTPFKRYSKNDTNCFNFSCLTLKFIIYNFQENI